MKTQKFESMKMQAEALAVYGDKNNVSTIKKSMALDAAIEKIENTTIEDVVNATLSIYKPVFNRLDKSIRGTAKKAFCDEVRNVCSRENNVLFAIDANGNIIAKNVVAKIRKRDNAELWQLLSNLLQDAAKGAIEQAEQAEQDKKNDVYLDALLECALLAA